MTDLDELEHPAIRTAVQTCIACPDQWDGWLNDGRAFYFRYRSGRATLAVGTDPRAVNGVCTWAMAQAARVGYAELIVGDSLSGAFDSDAERSETFRRLYAAVAPAGDGNPRPGASGGQAQPDPGPPGRASGLPTTGA